MGTAGSAIPEALKRKSAYLSHAVFNTHHSESEMLRYIRTLESRDLSLTHSMIPLGSCTMKLNATSEMIPIGWREFAHIHPFAPEDQVEGYRELIDSLEARLVRATGYAELPVSAAIELPRLSKPYQQRQLAKQIAHLLA